MATQLAVRLTKAVVLPALLVCGPAMAAAQSAAPAPRFEFHGLVQGWFAADDSINTFRVRRAELAAVGQLGTRLRWKVQIDPSKVVTVRNEFADDRLTNVTVDVGTVLQDAQISYLLGPLVIDAGQFKVPVGREGLQSSSTIEVAERTLQASTTNKFGDVRDIGVQVRIAAGGGTQAVVGVFNGMGERINRLDASTQKALLGRLVTALPLLPGLSVGVTAGTVIGPDDHEANRSRLGADVLYERGGVTVRSEIMSGADGAFDRRGFYALAAYRFAPSLQAAFRYDVWDPDLNDDTTAAGAREQDLVGGLTWSLPDGYAKLQASYFRKTFGHQLVPTRNVLVLNAQLAW